MIRRAGAARDPRWWLALAVEAGIVATAAYVLDPIEGHGRRRRIADRTAHRVRAARKAMLRVARHATATIRGRGRRLLLGGRPVFADGRVLLDRVESELFRDPTIPRGRMNLDVDGLTVVLRGALDSGEDMARVERAVAAVPGVAGVRTFLHLVGTPAPNKVAALFATER